MKLRKLMFTMFLCSVSLTACSASAKELNNDGIAYYNKEEYSKAAEVFKQATEKDPKNEEYYMNLGLAYLELTEYEEAEEAFLMALDCNPDNMKAQLKLAMVHYYSDDYQRALLEFKTVVEKAKEDYNETTLEALQYCAFLQTYYEDYAGAIDSYTILINKNYNVEYQYFFRGSIFAGQGMENEAVLDFEKALEGYGDEYEIYYNIYYDFMKAGYEDRAMSYLKRALNVEGADNLLKGKTYYILEDYDNAKSYLSKALDENKSEAEYFMAMVYEKMGDIEEAESLYKSYLKKVPDDARAYNQYGMYQLEKGDCEAALASFQKGIELNSEEAMRALLFNEACCYERMHEYKTAYQKFQEYLKLYPDDEAAQHEFDFLSTR